MIKLKSLKRPPVLAAFVAVLAFTGIGGNHYTSRPSFCGACHEMKSIHEGWTASAHAGSHCYDCHTDKGLAGTVKAKVQGLREVLIHFTRPVDMAAVKSEVPGHRCVACHDMNDKAKLGDRTVLTHQKHLEAKLDCVACHAVVGHTRAAFGGFGSPTCNPCHDTKPQEKPSNYIRKTPCSRTEATTATLAAS